MKKQAVLILVIIFLIALGMKSGGLLDKFLPRQDQDQSTGIEDTGDVSGDTDSSRTDSSSGSNSFDSNFTDKKMVNMPLFFPNNDNSAIKQEKRDVEVIDKAIIKAAVTALIQGPQGSGLRNAFPEGTKLLSVNMKNGTAILDFSREFTQANNIADIVLRASIANTLTGIQGVERVRILVEGTPLTGPGGYPLEDMQEFRLDDEGRPLPGQS